MKTSIIALLVVSSALAANAQGLKGAPERPPEYAHLENFVGRWTVKGNENTFIETCAWYHGNFHIVCNSEFKRRDGSTGHGMSILSFVPGQGYVYTGIGSRGRYKTHQGGTFRDGIFEFLDISNQNGKSVVTRTRIGPYTPAGFPFAVDTSTDRGAWTAPETDTYIRLK